MPLNHKMMNFRRSCTKPDDLRRDVRKLAIGYIEQERGRPLIR